MEKLQALGFSVVVDDEGDFWKTRDLGRLAFTGSVVSDVTLQCNLLVVEPNERDKTIHAMAFRYINAKTISSHPARKQERVNMLRLYALLVQEKIFRDPVTMGVAVAQLLPRYSGDFALGDRYPDYFSLTDCHLVLRAFVF